MIKSSSILTSKTAGRTVWYHGSTRPRTTWDLSSVGNGNDQEGPGLYFATSLADARAYGDYIALVYLTTTNKMPLKGRPDYNQIRNLIKKAPDLDMSLSNWDEDPHIALTTAVETIVSSASSPFDAYQQVWADFYSSAPQEYLKNLWRYDLAILPMQDGSFHAVVFHPSIIKTIKLTTKAELDAEANNVESV